LRRQIVNSVPTSRIVGDAYEDRHAARRVDGKSVDIAFQFRICIDWMPAVRKPLAVEQDDVRSDQSGDVIDESRCLTNIQESPTVERRRGSTPGIVELRVVPGSGDDDACAKACGFGLKKSKLVYRQWSVGLPQARATGRFTSSRGFHRVHGRA
jgi:hypothetical protein